MELRRFFRFLKPKDTDVISNAGYLKQRMKLNPEAFMYLSDLHVKNFHSDLKGHLAKMTGYYLFAVDGSKAKMLKKIKTFMGHKLISLGNEPR